MGGAPVQQPNDSISRDDRLDSWKDIAAYLKRSVPTVQRWEKEEGLPVHRHLHKKQGSIYAFKAELDEWQRQRGSTLEAPEPSERTPEPTSESPTPAGLSNRNRLLAIALSVFAIAAFATFLLLQRHTGAISTGTPRVMIAVLPFQNLGGGSQQEYVCDALTEELITELAALDSKRLGIIARTSAMVYKNGGRSVRDIGSQLGVQYLVEGSILFSNEKSRITVQLIRVSDQSHIWAHAYDDKIDDLLAVEQEVSRAVANEVNIHVTSVHQRATARISSDPQAYRLYLQGRELWRNRSPKELQQSVALLEESIKRDPKFAPAYAALADSYNQLGYMGYSPLGLTIPKAQSAAQHALQLDPQSSQAEAALGYIDAMWLWEWKKAEQEYQRALEFDPSNAQAHHYYALFLASAARLSEAQEQMSTAQRLNPLDPAVNSGYAYILYFAHRYQDSIEFCRRALQRDSDFAVAHAVMGWDDIQLQHYPEGISELRRALELSPENPLYTATLGRAYVLAGQQNEADRIAASLQDLSRHKIVSASMRAILQTANNDRDGALQSLADAKKQEDWFLLWLKVTPEFDPLRNDPRFISFLNGIDLPGSIQSK